MLKSIKRMLVFKWTLERLDKFFRALTFEILKLESHHIIRKLNFLFAKYKKFYVFNHNFQQQIQSEMSMTARF